MPPHHSTCPETAHGCFSNQSIWLFIATSQCCARRRVSGGTDRHLGHAIAAAALRIASWHLPIYHVSRKNHSLSLAGLTALPILIIEARRLYLVNFLSQDGRSGRLVRCTVIHVHIVVGQTLSLNLKFSSTRMRTSIFSIIVNTYSDFPTIPVIILGRNSPTHENA